MFHKINALRIQSLNRKSVPHNSKIIELEMDFIFSTLYEKKKFLLAKTVSLCLCVKYIMCMWKSGMNCIYTIYYKTVGRTAQRNVCNYYSASHKFCTL